MGLKKKLLKISFWFIGLAIPIVPVLAVIDYSNTSENFIFSSGSSSVLPLMSEFSNKYTKAQVVVSGGGSGKGLSDIANGNTDFGNVSSNKKSSILEDGYQERWETQNNKTITVAWDAIGIALHIPKGIKIKNDHPVTSEKQKPYQTNYPVVNISEIAKVYSTTEAGKVTWKDLLVNEEPNVGPLDTIVQGFGRTGGKAASGTSDGFFHTLEQYTPPGITLDENHLSSAITKTPEANAQAYARLNKGETTGITYLSLGYFEEAIQDPSNNLDITFIEAEDQQIPWKAPTIDNVNNDSYKWFRPYNTIFSLNANSYISDFAQWMLTVDGGQQYIKNVFLVPLNKNEITVQLQSLTQSDFALYNQNHNSEIAFGLQNKIADVLNV